MQESQSKIEFEIEIEIKKMLITMRGNIEAQLSMITEVRQSTIQYVKITEID